MSYDAAKKIAANLVEKQWLDRLKRGTYLIVPLAAGEHGAYTEHETLTDSLVRQGNGAAVKRVVYLADVLGIDLADRDRLEEAFTSGYSRLDPTRPGDGRHASTYRLMLNVPEDELLAAGEPP